MMKHKSVLAFGKLLNGLSCAIFLSLFLSLSAFAQQGHSVYLDEHQGHFEVPEAITEALQRDLGMAPDEIQEIMRVEHNATQVLAQAGKTLGSDYGGGWIERDEDGKPFVVVGSAAPLAALQSGESPQATTPGSIGLDAELVRSVNRVDIRHVQFSLERLEKTVQAFNEAHQHPLARSLEGIHSWGIDLPANRVVVVTSPDVSDLDLDFFAASGIELDILDFEVSDHPPSTLANIVGGFRYNGCSIGFAVRRGSTPGFATAGHCGSVGTPVRISNQLVGYFQRSNFPGSDAAWANVRTSDRLYNLVWRYSGSSTYPVTGSSEAALGATVCRSGFRTGWRCGTLTRNNVTVNYGSGSVYGLRESNACAGQGDSGGSWVAAGYQAQGVTSGGSLGSDGTNCGIPQSQRRTWFQRINPILSGYGLTLVTN